jgi:hypothetical protein
MHWTINLGIQLINAPVCLMEWTLRDSETEIFFELVGIDLRCAGVIPSVFVFR